MPRYGPPPRPVEDRFWDHVERGSSRECWEWRGARNLDGYGYLTLTRTPRTWIRAHRLSWEIHKGVILPGEVVCHHCDNPPCVNPAHLFLGTRKENNADRASKGRGRENRQQGQANTNAKLTEDDVRAIIAVLRVSTRSQADVAAMFGVSQQTVSRIVRRKSWTHLWDE